VMSKIERNHWYTSYGEPWNKADFEKLCATDLDDTLFSVKPHLLQTTGIFPIVYNGALLRIFSKELHIQGAVLVLVVLLLGYIFFATGLLDYEECQGNDFSCYQKYSAFLSLMALWESEVGSLASFVGGLFISLALSRTYYANRGLLGTVFGETLGFAMAVATCIKPIGTENGDYSVNLDLMGKSAIDFLNKNGIPDDECKKLTKAKVDGALLLLLDPDGLIKLGISVTWAYKIHDLVQKCKSAHAYSESVKDIEHYQNECVRLVNAGFRILYIEHIEDDQKVPELGLKEVMDDLLSEEEWKHIDGIPSRATYVYSWIGDLLHQAYEKGYISSEHEFLRMYEFIEKLRAANVWGLPSLPYPYVIWITVIVKTSLYLSCIANAIAVAQCFELSEDGDSSLNDWWGAMIAVVMNVLMMNFAWQGMLDLHAMLRNPNQGKLVGHMPTPVFLDFTKRVCFNTVEYLSSAPHNNDGRSLRMGEDKDSLLSSDSLQDIDSLAKTPQLLAFQTSMNLNMNITDARKSFRQLSPKFPKSSSTRNSPIKKRPVPAFGGRPAPALRGARRNPPSTFQKKGKARPPPMIPGAKPLGRLPPSFPKNRKGSRPPPPLPIIGTE